MQIICFIPGISVDGANIFFRNPQWYQKPERGFDCVIAKERHILDDYKKIGVPEYGKEEVIKITTSVDFDVIENFIGNQEGEKIVLDTIKNTEVIEIEEDSKIVEELSWNEMRRLAKELSGEVIKTKEQAQQILANHGY